jgi:hypothetical protein
MPIIKVKCTLFVDVEVPDDPEYDVRSDIEERHCPGTGIVGSALKKKIEDYEDRGFCWGCPGENEIVDEEASVT